MIQAGFERNFPGLSWGLQFSLGSRSLTKRRKLFVLLWQSTPLIRSVGFNRTRADSSSDRAVHVECVLKLSPMKTLLLSIVVASLPLLVFAQAGRGGPASLSIQPVKPGLYVVAGAGANSLIRVTNDGVILVDGKLPGDQNYSALIDQIKTVTAK